MASSPSMDQLVADVAELKRDVAELKRAAVQTTEILIDHSNRFDRLERKLDDNFSAVDGKLSAVTERLDRLIAVTMAERTTSAERLGAIDQRLDRLEPHPP